MDNIIYTALSRYYHALELKGYMPYIDTVKLLILIFYHDFMYKDFRSNISQEDYYLIERALYCLYGSNCLIPYPDYMKTGQLKLGEITEMATRLRNLEDTPVLKLIHDTENAEGGIDSDIQITVEEDS